MRELVLALLAGFALAACSDGASDAEIAAANINLRYAGNELAEGRSIDRAELEALRGLEVALVQRAQRAKEAVQAQMRDPTNLIWGDIWTPDLIMICGTVNGRNAYGAYAGDEVFYAPDGISARLPGHYQYEASDLEKCWKGAQHRVIIPAERPPA